MIKRAIRSEDCMLGTLNGYPLSTVVCITLIKLKQSISDNLIDTTTTLCRVFRLHHINNIKLIYRNNTSMSLPLLP